MPFEVESIVVEELDNPHMFEEGQVLQHFDEEKTIFALHCSALVWTQYFCQEILFLQNLTPGRLGADVDSGNGVSLSPPPGSPNELPEASSPVDVLHLQMPYLVCSPQIAYSPQNLPPRTSR